MPDPTSPPYISLELVEWLEEVFPNQLPRADRPLDLEKLNIDRGVQSLIQTLRQHHERQELPE